MIDYDVHRASRRCAATDREFAAGESIVSALIAEGGQVVRRDYAASAWTEPPAGTIGWWRSHSAGSTIKKPEAAPGEVLISYFEQLEHEPAKADVRYFLALLMVRRKIFRQEAIDKDEHGNETLSLFCPRNETEYRTPVTMPSDERLPFMQAELTQLLQADTP